MSGGLLGAEGHWTAGMLEGAEGSSVDRERDPVTEEVAVAAEKRTSRLRFQHCSDLL
jgi:hypothetical protein